MSLRIGTPVNQRRLTNVSVVRLNRNKKRYEIACYNNKVLSWRQGIETDLGEVLQSEFVFFNVGKGEFAKAKDMKAAFGSDDPMVVARIILEEGELQVSGKERERESDAMFRDVANIVAEKTVNPRTGRPFTVSTISAAMKDDLHFSVNNQRTAKQQALEVIKRLPSAGLPIVRAPMLVRVTQQQQDGKEEEATATATTTTMAVVISTLTSKLGAVHKKKQGQQGGGGQEEQLSSSSSMANMGGRDLNLVSEAEATDFVVVAGGAGSGGRGGAGGSEDFYIEPDAINEVSAAVAALGNCSLEVVELAVHIEEGQSPIVFPTRINSNKGVDFKGSAAAAAAVAAAEAAAMDGCDTASSSQSKGECVNGGSEGSGDEREEDDEEVGDDDEDAWMTSGSSKEKQKQQQKKKKKKKKETKQQQEQQQKQAEPENVDLSALGYVDYAEDDDESDGDSGMMSDGEVGDASKPVDVIASKQSKNNKKKKTSTKNRALRDKEGEGGEDEPEQQQQQQQHQLESQQELPQQKHKQQSKTSKAAKRREKEAAEEKKQAKEKADVRAAARLKARQERDGGIGGGGACSGAAGASAGGEASSSSSSSSLSCTTCGGSFSSPAEHRAHFKSDWHRYNLKLKLEGQPPVSEAEFAIDADDLF